MISGGLSGSLFHSIYAKSLSCQWIVMLVELQVEDGHEAGEYEDIYVTYLIRSRVLHAGTFGDNILMASFMNYTGAYWNRDKRHIFLVDISINLNWFKMTDIAL